MLTLHIDRLMNLFEYVNDFDMCDELDSLTYDIVTEFKNCFSGDSITFDMVIKELYGIGKSVFDYRSDVLESVMDTKYNVIVESNNIFLTPLDLLLHKYQDKDNYFLTFQQKNKSRIINNQIDISGSEVLESYILLSAMSLIPIGNVEKYATSITMENMLTVNALMSIMAEDDKQNNPMGLSKVIDSKGRPIEFEGLSRIQTMFNDSFIHHRNAFYSYEIKDALSRDVATIKYSNEDKVGFINQFVLRYIDYCKYLIDDHAATLNTMRELQKIHMKYNHMLTALILQYACLMTTIDEADNSLGGSWIKGNLYKPDLSSYDNGLSTFIKVYCESLDVLKWISPLVRKRIEDDCNLVNGSLTFPCDELNESDQHNIPQAIKVLNESFKILKDGSLRVVLDRKTSYMDEYATNHRLLKLNDKNGDINSMKYNLVYALLLIEGIEKNVLHNDKVDKNSATYKDAEKAKGFAMNDIATYLPKVKRADPNFDLNKFYKEVKADRCTIDIDVPSTISGLKRIVKSILV